eukprot:6932218-Pyramimonas_sp.AAC.1
MQTTGLTPSVLHGAAVMGVAEKALQPVRALAGALAGAKAAPSLNMAVVMQPSPRYDPMFKATLELPYMYACMPWDGKLPLQRLQQAWEATRTNVLRSERWSKVTGPLSATWMTLRRVGWSKSSAYDLVDDQSQPLSLLQTPPRD